MDQYVRKNTELGNFDTWLNKVDRESLVSDALEKIKKKEGSQVGLFDMVWKEL